MNTDKNNIPPLGSLYINPTRYCNLRCKHCWVAPPNKEKLTDCSEELSVDEMVAILRVAMELGLKSVKITGGEPLLRKDLAGLLEFCSGEGLEIIVETNGTLITRDVANMLRKNRINHISVSLDSSYQKKHDMFRGKAGAFEKAVEGIRNLVAEDLAPQVIMTLYKESMKDFHHFLEFMEELGVNDIKINIVSCIGRGQEMQHEGTVPTVEEVLSFAEIAKKAEVSFKGRIYLDIPMAFKSLEKIKKGKLGVCAIKSILGLFSDGNVSLCGIGYMDDNLIFGNVRKDPLILKDIWVNNPVLKRVREDLPVKLEGVCGICVFKKLCIGDCRAEAYYEKGDLITAPSNFCQGAYEKGLFPMTRIIPEAIRV